MFSAQTRQVRRMRCPERKRDHMVDVAGLRRCRTSREPTGQIACPHKASQLRRRPIPRLGPSAGVHNGCSLAPLRSNSASSGVGITSVPDNIAVPAGAGVEVAGGMDAPRSARLRAGRRAQVKGGLVGVYIHDHRGLRRRLSVGAGNSVIRTRTAGGGCRWLTPPTHLRDAPSPIGDRLRTRWRPSPPPSCPTRRHQQPTTCPTPTRPRLRHRHRRRRSHGYAPRPCCDDRSLVVLQHQPSTAATSRSSASGPHFVARFAIARSITAHTASSVTSCVRQVIAPTTRAPKSPRPNISATAGR